MTNRKIVLTDCGDCHNRDHNGAFANPAYVPSCTKAKRNLPYTVSPSPSGNSIWATRTPGIPDWCPLPEDKS